MQEERAMDTTRPINRRNLMNNLRKEFSRTIRLNTPLSLSVWTN